MKKYDDVLRSCDLQFDFKGHSTVMCTAMFKKTISHYMVVHNREVYVCLLDASKAFDRVEYGNLFQDLIITTNEVKQGGILSPILFSIYIEKTQAAIFWV